MEITGVSTEGRFRVLYIYMHEFYSARELLADDFKIWNSLGDSRHCLPPPTSVQ